MGFELVALDADDTLWHNEIHYRQGREVFSRIMERYSLQDHPEPRLHEIEIANLKYYGYGAVGFAISMAEAALELTEGEIESADLFRLIEVSKDIISADVELFEGVESAVRTLCMSHKLMLLTKGNEHHQLSKIDRSGLKSYFQHVQIVSDKTASTYAAILEDLGIPSQRFIMVGNAMKSDILPVLEIGGYAVYIHNDLTWEHEMAEHSGVGRERFFELERISELPALVSDIEAHMSVS
jgi:putative hydrolase of the HAD superfamily